MSKNDDYAIVNLFDCLYHQNDYKIISIDLSRQTNTTTSQQVSSRGKLEENDGSTMTFYWLKAAENYSKLFFKFIKHKRITWTMEHQKIWNLLNELRYSQIKIKNWTLSVINQIVIMMREMTLSII